MITAKINVTKIDKSKLFKGEKGTYLDIVLIQTEDDKYGNDYVVVQGVSKEERAAGVKGAILGNAKIFQSKKKSAPKNTNPEPVDEDSDVPF